MSRQMRDWLGRAASPIRARWRASANPASSARSANPANPASSASSASSANSDSSAEARAGALFAQAVQRDPLPQERLTAIAARLRSHPKRRRAGPPRLVVRLAAGLSLLIVGGALAATATRYFNLPLPFGRPAEPSPRSPSPARRVHVGQSGQPGDGGKMVQAPSGSPAEAVAVSRVVERPEAFTRPRESHVAPGRRISARERPQRPSQLRSPSPSSPPPPPPPSPSSPSPPPSEIVEPAPPLPATEPLEPPDDPSPRAPAQLAPSALPAPPRPAPTALAEESALVMSALTALRRQDDPGRALAILDRYDRRFPRGDLADEAALARVEALVKVKRSEDALALLEARGPIRRGSSQRKLVLMRAELRAASGGCAAALNDLDAVLRGAPPADAVTERALWGRAACRASRGQADSARADLHSYLRLFPSGQFARGARAALEHEGGGLPSPKP